MNGEPEKPPLEEAVFRPSRWPGLIWAVPIAALAIIAWLGIGALLRSGPSVTVSFPVTGGLKPGSTKVEYLGYQVGEVSNVTLAKSLGEIKVKIDFNASMNGHLGPGTRYWIAGKGFNLNNLSSIKDLISGPVIGVEPHPGKTVGKVQGLGSPPALRSAVPGLAVTLTTSHLGHVSEGSPVFYKGYKLGEVLGVSLAPDGKQFTIRVFVKAPWQKLVTTDTRFWNAGAVRLSAGGNGPGVQLESVPALIEGAVAFETPPGSNAPAAQPNAHFKLYDSKGQAQNAPDTGAVKYSAVFPGGPHGLSAGAPVQLEGAPAGTVTAVLLRYDTAQHRLQTQVMLTLQPQRIGLADTKWNLSAPAPQMNAMLTDLIGEGLRATIASSVPVVGGKMVSLTVVKDAPPARLRPGNPPQIPSFGNSGGGVSDVLAQLNDILASVNAMPLDEIAENVHSATRRLAALANSAQTRRTLRHLDRTMTNVEQITGRTNAQLPAILAAVRQSARQAQAALAAAQGLLSTQGPANAGPESADLPHALYELSQAAQSLRALTDFLDSHPGALIAGRGD